jgi:hypothetical protein
MKLTNRQIRYHATSMELAAYLDGRYVEMHIGTDTGQDIAVVCERDSIFAIQRHIEQLGSECPEISTWQTGTNSTGRRADDQRSYDAAISEGWPVARKGETSKLCVPIVERT